MKICPKCFAEYEDAEITQDAIGCIECYGEGVDVKLVDREKFIKSLSIEQLRDQRIRTKASTGCDNFKRILLRRIDRLIVDKSQS